MAAKLTKALRQALLDSGAEPESFLAGVDEWRRDWPANEFESEYFGKHGGYMSPKADGHPYRLLHVHLKPIVDRTALAQWMYRFQNKSRKTSDRALIFVAGPKGSHLLITILPEPDAHRVVSDCPKLMNEFANVAAAFMNEGLIIA